MDPRAMVTHEALAVVTIWHAPPKIFEFTNGNVHLTTIAKSDDPCSLTRPRVTGARSQVSMITRSTADFQRVIPQPDSVLSRSQFFSDRPTPGTEDSFLAASL